MKVKPVTKAVTSLGSSAAVVTLLGQRLQVPVDQLDRHRVGSTLCPKLEQETFSERARSHSRRIEGLHDGEGDAQVLVEYDVQAPLVSRRSGVDQIQAPGAFARNEEEIQAPRAPARDDAIQSPRGDDAIQAPRGGNAIQAPRG